MHIINYHSDIHSFIGLFHNTGNQKQTWQKAVHVIRNPYFCVYDDKAKQLTQVQPGIHTVNARQRTLHATLNFSAASGSMGFDAHVRCDLRNRPKARPPTETASSTALYRPPVIHRILFMVIHLRLGLHNHRQCAVLQ